MGKNVDLFGQVFRFFFIIGLMLVQAPNSSGKIDLNANGLSDLWEMLYNETPLMPDADDDGDGFTNRQEAIAGTHPRDPQSRPLHALANHATPFAQHIAALPGKEYILEHSPDLSSGSWIEIERFAVDTPGTVALPADEGFYRSSVRDRDSSGDGLQDWEKILLGFNPAATHTDRYPDSDMTRAKAALAQTNILTLHAARSRFTRGDHTPALLVLRRPEGLGEITVHLEVSGAGLPDIDFSGLPSEVRLGFSERQRYLPLYGLTGSGSSPGPLSFTVRLTAGEAFQFGSSAEATFTLEPAPQPGQPTATEAARFLRQCTFGPTPAMVEEVRAAGFSQWLEAQFQKPIGQHRPILDQMVNEGVELKTNQKMNAWWTQAMRGPDPLRQRLAFALSQIMVVSDNVAALRNRPRGMASYYDMLLENAFGNFRDLLEAVTYHPCMGLYLSHRGNLPPDPTINRFPDENYAREVMQLFTIGLWKLNPDGSQQTDEAGNAIPTYSNDDITELARVFTGMSWGVWNTSDWRAFKRQNDPDNPDPDASFILPMKVWNGPFSIRNSETGEWEEVFYHDQGEKQFLGATLPASTGNDPAYARADIGRALDVLFEHPNVGPFIARLLIQRLVTSNPSPAYLERVTQAFNGNSPHNPESLRGDMPSVWRAILLDPEARDLSRRNDPHHGRLKEPYLLFVEIARAFNASSTSGRYEIYNIDDDFGMQPLRSPSVFNFYLPDFQPSGALRENGLVGPEFQITTAVTAITVPNLFQNRLPGNLSSVKIEEHEVYLDFDEAVALADDTDALINHLDQRLTGGLLSPESYATFYHALQHPRILNASAKNRAHLALYFFATSPEFAVLR
jgi:uncharacterized protein (DUF1800 family)